MPAMRSHFDKENLWSGAQTTSPVAKKVMPTNLSYSAATQLASLSLQTHPPPTWPPVSDKHAEKEDVHLKSSSVRIKATAPLDVNASQHARTMTELGNQSGCLPKPPPPHVFTVPLLPG